MVQLTDRYRRSPRPAGPRGLTLVELLLGLAITGVIGAAVTTMLFSTYHGSTSREELRTLLVRGEIGAMRLRMSLRSSTRVLARGDGYLVLWMGDTRANDAPDLSELRRIELDSDTGELLSYKAPADLPEAQDAEYDLATTDFGAVTNSLKGSASFPGQVWAADVTAWTTKLDAGDPQECGFVGYAITMTLNDVAQTIVSGAALRY